MQTNLQTRKKKTQHLIKEFLSARSQEGLKFWKAKKSSEYDAAGEFFRWLQHVGVVTTRQRV